MKNLIYYYYNLEISNFKKSDNKFLFKSNNKNYELIPFYGDIKELIQNYNDVKQNNKYCHTIILNKNMDPITFYNGVNYILIKKDINIKNYINIKEIMYYQIPNPEAKRLEWKKLWKEKIDYYEYQMGQLSTKYNIIKENFNYFIGLTETAISLLNFVDYSNVNNYVCHNRIQYRENLDNFFNPIYFVADSRVRDIAEFIKVNYIFNNIEFESTIEYIKQFNLNNDEVLMMLSRLLYPSYFFDVYDQIINEKIDEEKIKFYIQKSTSYEVFVKKIYIFLKSEYNIPSIEWLNY